MTYVRSYRTLAVFLAVLPLSGCLFRTRIADRPMSTTPLQTATQQQLIDYVNS